MLSLNINCPHCKSHRHWDYVGDNPVLDECVLVKCDGTIYFRGKCGCCGKEAKVIMTGNHYLALPVPIVAKID
jgi:hypothetical protein